MTLFDRLLINPCSYARECPYYRGTADTCNFTPGPYCGKWRQFRQKKLEDGKHQVIDSDGSGDFDLTTIDGKVVRMKKREAER